MNKPNIVAILTFIFITFFIIIGNTGIWYMPNISTQYAVSQNLTINTFSDPNAHYIYTNYLEPFIFNILGGTTLNEYLIFTLFITVVFLSIFIIWFLRYHNEIHSKNYYKFIPIITFSIFFVPFYWIGMDGMTLLIMLLVMIYYRSRWSILFAILLGTQHFEQGIASFLLLLGSLFIYNIFSKEEYKWETLKKTVYIILGIILGKILLFSYFNIMGIEILGNRATYLENHLDMFVNQWFSGWQYIFFSLFGLGWILVLKNIKIMYPLLLASLVTFVFIMTVGDQTRVGTIILFPSLFYWVFMNKEIYKNITIQFSILILAAFLLLPVIYVWGGYPFGSLLKYSTHITNIIKNKDDTIDFSLPFNRDNISKFNSIIYNASELNSNCGTKENEYRTAKESTDKPGHITFGPYISLSSGKYKFNINYMSSESNTTNVGTWDVVIALPKEGKQLINGTIMGTNTKDAHIINTFTISEEYNDKKVEVRNFYNGTGNLTIKSLTITKVE